MIVKQNKWTVEGLRSEALKYSTKGEFDKGNSKAYVAYYRVSRVEIMGNLVWWVDRLLDEDPAAYRSFQWEFDGVPEFTDRRI
ncbi:hypothetical protein E1297_04270, partial [Roseibium sp. RKSG952]|nr:hypothetical protein [Roseibium sp. RKSG952]